MTEKTLSEQTFTEDGKEFASKEEISKMETEQEMKERVKSAEVISRFTTHCPRCSKTAIVKRTATHFLTQCEHCGFDMGQVIEKIKD